VSKDDVLSAFDAKRRPHDIIRITQHQVVLDQDILRLEIGLAILAHEHEIGAGGALPVQKDITTHRDLPAAFKAIAVTITILDDDITTGVIVVGAPAALEIIE